MLKYGTDTKPCVHEEHLLSTSWRHILPPVLNGKSCKQASRRYSIPRVIVEETGGDGGVGTATVLVNASSSSSSSSNGGGGGGGHRQQSAVRRTTSSPAPRFLIPNIIIYTPECSFRQQAFLCFSPPACQTT